jgi:Ankyrin repeats (3 copies)
MSLPKHLPFDAPLTEYEAQADQLLAGHKAGVPAAIQILHECLPRFLDPVVTWKPLPIGDDEVLAASLTRGDTRLALARAYSFRDWGALSAYVAAVAEAGSATQQFETAVEAVIAGDADALRTMLWRDPALVRARSARITCHDPAVHAATLLHYLGANGVEGYRQRSPANAVEMARLLLDSGAEVDALAGLYGGQCTTLSLLISSTQPADAGVQVPLVNTLLDYGAAPDGVGDSQWKSPMFTALVFGFSDAAAAVAARGATVDTLAIAAGLGRVDDCAHMLPAATADDRHRAVALAAINDRVDVVALLLDAGVDPNRLNPDGMHSHQTPLHGAALAGQLALVRLLVERGARMDIPDTLWQSTALGWAEHAGQDAVMEYLRTKGAA